MTEQRFKIYYDGLCPICSREINHYRKKDPRKTIDFIDISQKNFDAKSEGLDPKKVFAKFHIKNTQGEILDGVDAFIAIWEHLKIFSALNFLANQFLLRPFFDLGYIVFAKIRPYLRKKDCESNLCKNI